MKSDQDIVAITTPAMIPVVLQWIAYFMHYPGLWSFDVGIAEEHALTLQQGLAISQKPFISIYSSFLQRAYDQINRLILQEYGYM